MHYRRVSYRYALVMESGPRPRGDPWVQRQPLGLSRPEWRPAFDLCETEEALVLRAELSDLDEEAVHVTLYEDALVVEGERPWEPVPEARYLAAEIARGPFRLEIPLAAPVEREQVAARLDRGVLVVTLPKPGWNRQ